jgi:hypothetical protein
MTTMNTMTIMIIMDMICTAEALKTYCVLYKHRYVLYVCYLNLLAGSFPGRGFGRMEQRPPTTTVLLVRRRREDIHILLRDTASTRLHIAQRPMLPLGPAK